MWTFRTPLLIAWTADPNGNRSSPVASPDMDPAY
jgi:hypothetical protein